MPRLAMQDIQEHFAATVSRVADTGERIVVESHGKDLAVLVSLEDLALLEELEDRLDLEDFRAAKEEWEREGRQTTTLDDLVKELGIEV